MTRAAVNAAAAADALLAWLEAQTRVGAKAAPMKSEGCPAKATPGGSPGLPDGRTLDVTTLAPVAGQHPAKRTEAEPQAMPMRLTHTDWLHHRLAIRGTADQLTAFRHAAAGAGIIPWQIDLDRMEEDVFHLLAAPLQPRTLSVAGARVLAGQLREAVGQRHERAVARVGMSQACPIDLHALVPVPDEMLQLGPGDPGALAWLWQHWGTTQSLRHVAEDVVAGQDTQCRSGLAAFHVTFWSADWTPWRALTALAERWPGLRFDLRPTYGGP
jgi:hypothetical protein